jgi:hypothetical protein
MGIRIWQCRWWEIDGFEIKNSAGRGILIGENVHGTNETPSVTHSNINRQAIVGLVVQTQ